MGSHNSTTRPPSPSKNSYFTRVSDLQVLIDSDKLVRAGQEFTDRVIFDMFDLTGNNFITKDDLAQMLVNLPVDAIVVEHAT